VEVGGRDGGGLAMFCSDINCKNMTYISSETYEVKFGLPACRHSDGLDTFLPRHLVKESKECLMGLHSLSSLSIDHLECKLEHIS
jgi:hypothetical protein